MLPRAINSLLNQTYKDWICEIHNDCPDDNFPEQYITALNDKRFIIKNHDLNLGAVQSFNFAFAGCDEKYASILEDDNWWEPSFLDEMIVLMDGNPNLDIAWCNMRIWKEQAENNWVDTGITTWPEKKDLSFSWPQAQQAFGALHSTGAMIYKGIKAPEYIIPNETLLNSIELVRERAFKHPIYLNSKVLANFAVTAFTNRSNEAWKWIGCQIMQLGSLIIASPDKKQTFLDSLNYSRQQKPNPVINHFLANLFLIKESTFYTLFNLNDWLYIGKWLIKNSGKIWQIKSYLKSQKSVYSYLLNQTQQRYKEAKAY